MIQSNQSYTSDGNFLSSVTDGTRNTVRYSYDTDTSTLTSVTDANGNSTSNTYDAMRRLKSTTSGDASATYTYNKDRLSKISHSGETATAYNFAYTTAGLTDKVKVGNAYTLVDNAYNSGTWTLASQTYGNGDAWHYEYNEFDDLVSSRTTGGTAGTELKYFYNSEGALARIEQYDTTLSGTSISTRTLVSTERYYYDSSDRMIRITRTDADGDTYTCYWEYDHNDNVTELVEVVNGNSVTTSYTYDDDQRVSSIAVNGASLTTDYDGYGRINKQITKHGSSTVLTDSYTYRNPGEGLTSTQVASLQISAGGQNTTYSYQYDANGNITSISDGVNTTTYAYDALNQLTRENNQAAGKTWVWTYDNGGNITSKTEYDYTTGTLGTALDTITYTYGDDDWGDLLTAYDGVTITHDGIGNPLNTGTWSYSWNGRQLESMTSGSTTWSYKYDSDGLRTSRSNGSTTYKYTYSGSSLVHMSVGSNTLRFAYDSNGAPMSVAYNGTNYYYVTNIQGDVIAILDSSGTKVVEYTYDAWGKLLSTSGTMSSTLGTHNPLRYRGYVYDHESGFYYLQSRYYDPEMGRFINGDSYPSTGQGILGNNMFVYCGNNPVTRADLNGNAWETIWDIISLTTSVAEVIANPADPWAWAGLVGDIADVVIPGIGGLGELVDGVKSAYHVVDAVDDVVDAARGIRKAADAGDSIKDSVGVYVVIYENGMNYIGKGDFYRATVSASQHASTANKVSSIVWAPMGSNEKAFMAEYLLQSIYGVGKDIAENYNKIWSPGLKKFIAAQ